MAIWTTDDPTGTHASEGDPCGGCGSASCDGECMPDEAELDAATRADRDHDESTNSDADVYGEDWPF